jgi:hypothetical protein
MGFNWAIVPTPLFYNSGIRLIAYMLGYRLNLRKISYWSIPDVIELLINKTVGINGHIAILIGNSLSNLSSSGELHAGIINSENGQLTSFKIISKQDIDEIFNKAGKMPVQSLQNVSLAKKIPATLYDRKSPILRNYRLALIQKFGFIDEVIWINQKLIDQLFTTLILKLNRYSIWVLKDLTMTFDLLKDPNYFAMVPDSPFFTTLRTLPTKRFIKQITPILTDMHEF